MQAVLFSLLATILGTLLGSLIAVWAGNRSPKIINYLLSLAAGVMLSLVFFDLVPEVLKIASVPLTILGIGIGIAVILIFDTVSDKMAGGKDAEIPQAKVKNEILRSGYIFLNKGNNISLCSAGSLFTKAFVAPAMLKEIQSAAVLYMDSMDTGKSMNKG